MGSATSPEGVSIRFGLHKSSSQISLPSKTTGPHLAERLLVRSVESPLPRNTTKSFHLWPGLVHIPCRHSGSIATARAAFGFFPQPWDSMVLSALQFQRQPAGKGSFWDFRNPRPAARVTGDTCATSVGHIPQNLHFLWGNNDFTRCYVPCLCVSGEGRVGTRSNISADRVGTDSAAAAKKYPCPNPTCAGPAYRPGVRAATGRSMGRRMGRWYLCMGRYRPGK